VQLNVLLFNTVLFFSILNVVAAVWYVPSSNNFGLNVINLVYQCVK